MDLSRIGNNLNKAYEKLGWEERKTLLDNLHSSFVKGEISSDEFGKLLNDLGNSCPTEDKLKMIIFVGKELGKIAETYLREYLKERIYRYFFMGLSMEMSINWALYFRIEDIEKDREVDLVDDKFFDMTDKYQIIKKELCNLLYYYGLTEEQRKSIMEGNLCDYASLIMELPNSKEPDFELKFKDIQKEVNT
jgi:hypothetical protein